MRRRAPVAPSHSNPKRGVWISHENDNRHIFPGLCKFIAKPAATPAGLPVWRPQFGFIFRFSKNRPNRFYQLYGFAEISYDTQSHPQTLDPCAGAPGPYRPHKEQEGYGRGRLCSNVFIRFSSFGCETKLFMPVSPEHFFATDFFSQKGYSSKPFFPGPLKVQKYSHQVITRCHFVPSAAVPLTRTRISAPAAVHP